MISNTTTKMTLAAGAALAAQNAVAQMDTAAVDQAFDALKTYDWGVDQKTLSPIDEAVIATHGNTEARKALEKRLADALSSGLTRSAQDYVCRKLRIIGTAQSVKALAALLDNEDTSSIARYALERIQDKAAVAAMRDALPKVSDKLKPGLIGSLGKCGDTQSIDTISKMLSHSDVNVARSAAQALALLGTPDAAKALSQYASKAPAAMQIPVADASLICAEKLLADGNKTEAVALYTAFRGDDQPSQIKVAAMKGLLTAATQR